MKGWSELKKFYRSREKKWVAGVCGGLAEKFGISPLWVRLAFVLLVAIGGFPIVIVYSVLWLVLPFGPE